MATKMFSLKRALLYAFLLAVLLEPISGRKGYSGSHSAHGGSRHSGGYSGGHGYPSSGGSHSASHAYPSSSGLSGGGSKHSPSGGSHAYPSSGGLSGGNPSYPSSGGFSGGSHSYPSSGTGLSGTGSKHTSYPSSGGLSGGNPSYPSSGGLSGSGSHKYPNSGGTHSSSSGSHSYPSSGSGLSGGGSSNKYPQKPVVHHTTTHTVHHYHYAPPQQISYTPVRGGAPVYYPVYHHTPPTYVYQYKNSDSKYGTLLAGLALFNLGALAGNAYAHSGNSGSRTQYTPQPGEVCKFAIKRENGDYEETKIDCQIISSFIYQDQAQTSRPAGTNTTTSVVTVTNTTVTNTSNMMPVAQGAMTPSPAVGNVMYTMLPNGTLVPVNMTGVPIPPMNVTQNVSPQLAANGVVTSSVVTTTTTNTTLVNALDVKGKPVTVTPGMECFVIRNSPTHNMRKHVPCGLLQTYADTSIKRNSAARNGPMFTVVAAILAFCLVY